MTPMIKPVIKPVKILIAALGGEGGGVLADWIVHAASASGYPVQATSIPGVAQRTGATTYYSRYSRSRSRRAASGPSSRSTRCRVTWTCWRSPNYSNAAA